jgi:hypothetical protein
MVKLCRRSMKPGTMGHKRQRAICWKTLHPSWRFPGTVFSTRVSALQYTTQNKNVGQRKSFKTLRVTALYRTNKASWWVSAPGEILSSKLWRHSLMEKNVGVGTGTTTTAWETRRCTPCPGPLTYGVLKRHSAKGIQLAIFSLGNMQEK